MRSVVFRILGSSDWLLFDLFGTCIAYFYSLSFRYAFLLFFFFSVGSWNNDPLSEVSFNRRIKHSSFLFV